MISPATALNPRTTEARRAEILERATETGKDAVLVFAYGSALGAGSNSHGAMRYLTGWDSHEAMSLLFINNRDIMIFIRSPFMVPIARERLQSIEILDLRPSECVAVIQERLAGVKNVGTIGFDEMPLSLYRSLVPAFENFQLQPLDRQLGAMQLIKDDEALRLHKTGAEICDALFGALREEISKKKPCWQTQLALETKARGLGADYCRTWLTAKAAADHPRYWPEEGLHVPQPGDQVLFGIALTVAGHWAHGIRMGSMGPAPAHQVEMWRRVSEMLQAGLAALQPGQALSGCTAAIEKLLHGYSSTQERSEMRGFRHGHGLGMSYEDPFITDCFPQSSGAAVSSGTSDPTGHEAGAGFNASAGHAAGTAPELLRTGQGWRGDRRDDRHPGERRGDAFGVSHRLHGALNLIPGKRTQSD